MNKDGKTNETEVTADGAVEIQDEQLDTASGGATDFLLELDGVKGESKDRSPRTAGYDLKAAKKV